MLLWGLLAMPCRAGDDPVRIGVLDDMSGPYAAVQGPGDVLAAQMAAEDFGGTVLGRNAIFLTLEKIRSALACSLADSGIT